MSGKPIRGPLLRYLHDKVGQRIYVDNVATEMNESIVRVRSGLNNLLNDHYDLFRVATDVWDVGNTVSKRPAPDAPPKAIGDSGRTERRMFEEVGATKDGGIVLECEDGKLYKATEL